MSGQRSRRWPACAGPLIMIAGGEGKKQDFAPLAAAFRGKVRHAVLIGRDAPLLEQALRGVCHARDMPRRSPQAVRAAARAARAGDTVLLSPACASLDMFRDYAHRGAVFAQAVAGARGMSAARAIAHGFRALERQARRRRAPGYRHHRAALCAIVLLGLVMVTSASVSIASQESGQPFYYLERQLLLTLVGAACAALMFCDAARNGWSGRRCRCSRWRCVLLVDGAACPVSGTRSTAAAAGCTGRG